MKIWSSIDRFFTASYNLGFSISSIQPSNFRSSKCLSMFSATQNWLYKISSRGCLVFIYFCLSNTIFYVHMSYHLVKISYFVFDVFVSIFHYRTSKLFDFFQTIRTATGHVCNTSEALGPNRAQNSLHL